MPGSPGATCQVILDILADGSMRFVQSILDETEDRGHTLVAATVYRNLAGLQGEGVVGELQVGSTTCYGYSQRPALAAFDDGRRVALDDETLMLLRRLLKTHPCHDLFIRVWG